MRTIARLTVGLPLLIAANSAVPAEPAPLSDRLAEAQAEARTAEARMERMERAAAAARGEAERLRARQAAAAEAIAAAEARISGAEVRLRMLSTLLARRQQMLERQQEPAGALLAGLAMMASRPPILSVLDEGSADEFVRVKLLLDATLPEIRRRTAALSLRVEESRRLREAAQEARSALLRERQTLDERQKTFAALEEQALVLAAQRGSEAIGAGDEALALSEEAAGLIGEREASRFAAAFAARLSRLPAAPPRPFGGEGEQADGRLRYVLPSNARVEEGFGAVNAGGIRSRGLTLSTRRGERLKVPAAGVVRFSGPFRRYDGIVIIDHGGGWTSLIVDVASPWKTGERVTLGQPLGRALGPIGVELSTNGRRVSPALIAGSYANLSNGRDSD